MNRTLSFSFLLLILMMAGTPASAANMTIAMSNLDHGSSTEILVYSPDNTYLGTYNTTDLISLDDSQDYIFVLKPEQQHWFDNPLNTVEWIGLETPTVLSYALWILVVLGPIYILLKRL